MVVLLFALLRGCGWRQEATSLAGSRMYLFTRLLALNRLRNPIPGIPGATNACGPAFYKARSGIGNHAGNLRVIRFRYQGRAGQMALYLGGLGGQKMSHGGLSALDLAGSGLLEPLGGATMCL